MAAINNQNSAQGLSRMARRPRKPGPQVPKEPSGGRIGHDGFQASSELGHGNGPSTRISGLLNGLGQDLRDSLGLGPDRAQIDRSHERTRHPLRTNPATGLGHGSTSGNLPSDSARSAPSRLFK